MTFTTNHCPDQGDLLALADGVLATAKAQSVRDHLAACDECSALFEKMVDQTIVGDSHGTPAELQFRDQPWLEKSIGDYELKRKLGQGGMGTVYEAIHTRLARRVAIKVLSPGMIGDSDAVARFDREMKAVGRLDHPNVVRATDAGEADGVHFLVMELVDGADLSALVNRVGRLSIADACDAICQALDGMQHAHEKGLVHRDLKPSNLMLTREGQVKILDLGLARIGGLTGEANELTGTGQVMGTLDYMAPEQTGDSRDVDCRADIYSLGATLYKLLCGTAPFGGDQYSTLMSKVKAIALDKIPPIHDRRPDVPAELCDLLERMLAREPEERFATANETAKALKAFAEGSSLAELVRVSIKAGSDDTPTASRYPNQQGTSLRLLERLRQSEDDQSWSEFVDLYSPLLYHWARKIGLSSTDAADVVQDVFTVLVRELPRFQYDPTRNFRSWLRAITMNKARDNLRRKASRPTLTRTTKLEGIQVNDEDWFSETEFRNQVVGRALQVMQVEFNPTTWKACLEQVAHGRKAGDVAAELGISVNAAYVAKCRVLRRLRERLDGFLE